jgi:NADP-dependent aldehyde dehydrogenase
MLNKNISNAYTEGIKTLQSTNEITVLAQSSTLARNGEARPAAFIIQAAEFIADKKFSQEVFGPTTLVVLCKDEAQLTETLRSLDGQLTVTVHSVTSDEKAIKPLIHMITQKAGRIIYGGYPTGVEVCHSMQHGGPYPSTTISNSTSVGSAAISRFLRPVAFQDFPDHLLPEGLKDENPLRILRLVDGTWTKDKIGYKETNN